LDGCLNIDLNKTKDLVDDWGKKMQGLVKEFDKIVKEIDDKVSPESKTELSQ